MVRVILLCLIFIFSNAFSDSDLVSVDYFNKPPAQWNGITEGYARVNFSRLLQRAKEGDLSAQLHLGDIFYQGHGVTRNEKEALKWWELATNNKNKDHKHWAVVACYRIASYYKDKDSKKMNRALKKASQLNDQKVTANLKMLKGIY